MRSKFNALILRSLFDKLFKTIIFLMYICRRCRFRWSGVDNTCPQCGYTSRRNRNLSLRRPILPVPMLVDQPSDGPTVDFNDFGNFATFPFPVDTRSVPRITPDEFDHRKVESADVQKETMCSICLEQFGQEEKVCELPCKHIFHDECVRGWFRRHATCPVCRKPLGPQQEEQADFLDMVPYMIIRVV
jgi:ribosomal protein L40E